MLHKNPFSFLRLFSSLGSFSESVTITIPQGTFQFWISLLHFWPFEPDWVKNKNKKFTIL